MNFVTLTQHEQDVSATVETNLQEKSLQQDYIELLKLLAVTIIRASPEGSKLTRNSIRHFCRHFLGMKSEAHEVVRKSLTGDLVLSEAEISHIRSTLVGIESGSILLNSFQKNKKKSRRKRPESPARNLAKKEDSTFMHVRTGVVRKVIDHSISLFNSLLGLVVESGIQPQDVFDGDRMQIRGAVKKICVTFGIDVVFPESNRTQNHPLTQGDLSALGMSSLTVKKGKKE